MAHLRFGGQVSFYQSQIHEKIPFWHFHKQLSWFFSRALQGATLHMSLCDVSGCLSVCPFQETPPPPPTKCDFWAAQAILSNFHFQKKITQFFFAMSCGWRKARHNATKHSGFSLSLLVHMENTSIPVYSLVFNRKCQEKRTAWKHRNNFALKLS